MHRVGHVVAIAPDPNHVDELVAELAQADLLVAVEEPRPGEYELEDESLHEHLQAAERGVFVGIGVGAVVGLAVVLAVGAFADLSATARWLLIGGIALQGVVPAIMWRMGQADHMDNDPAETRVLGPQDRLIVVDALHDERRARAILERHGAVFLTHEPPHAVAG